MSAEQLMPDERLRARPARRRPALAPRARRRRRAPRAPPALARPAGARRRDRARARRRAVLDVGCGPGRHVGELAARGVMALGVDASPDGRPARPRPRRRGARGLDLRARPGPGHWGSALLLDGNLGIGGDPARLLRRVGELLVPGGSALVELDPPGSPTRSVRARLEGTHGPAPGSRGRWSAPAACTTWPVLRCGPRDLEHGGRWFAELA